MAGDAALGAAAGAAAGSVISPGVGTVIGGVLGLIGGGISGFYQHWANKRAEHREDNAIQRRYADLQAAGINPILAAGQSAESGAPEGIEDPIMKALTAGQMGAQLLGMQTQNKLLGESLLQAHDQTMFLQETHNARVANEIKGTPYQQQLSAESQARVDNIRQQLGINAWEFAKQRLLGYSKTASSGFEKWQMMMNDPEVPMTTKILFGLNQGYEEVKDWFDKIGN